MKKLLVLTSIIFIMTSSTVYADYADNTQYNNVSGGYAGASQDKATTVASVKTFADNSYISLQGNIVSKIGKEKYLFKDSTGAITVEIDDKVWAETTVNANDTVKITGEVDKDFNSLSVEVDTISVIK